MIPLRLTWTGLAALVVALALTALILMPVARKLSGSRARASCLTNLKQIGMMFKMYANEHNGLLPPRSPAPGNWMADAPALYPDYLTDAGLFICPADDLDRSRAFTLRSAWRHPGFSRGDRHPGCVSARSYNYTGYAINGDEQALGLYLAWEATGGSLPGQLRDLPIPQWPKSDWNPPGQGIPLLWDRARLDPTKLAHTNGINVLHLDGSATYVPYSPLNTSSNFPATQLSAVLFGEEEPQMPTECG